MACIYVQYEVNMKICSWRHLVVYGTLLGSLSFSGNELLARGEHGGMHGGGMGMEREGGIHNEGNFEHSNRNANFDHFNRSMDPERSAYDRGFRHGAAEGAAVEGAYGGYGGSVVVPEGQNLYDSDVNNDNVNLDDSLPNQQTPTGGRIINE